MYYPDLSKYQYTNNPATRQRGAVVLNVGWLDGEHEYPQGSVSTAFMERLWLIWEAGPINGTWGYHPCELCKNKEYNAYVRRDDQNIPIGSSEIRVVSLTNIVYAAPELILHYIIEHSYLPPSEFIEAVTYGPLPSSPEYSSVIKYEI